MKRAKLILAAFLVGCSMSALGGSMPSGARSTAAPSSSGQQASSHEDDADRLQGEQRFRSNCGRCHQPPHKFPPRMMATIIRHMRVRAMLTDEDMRLILKYMTQ